MGVSIKKGKLFVSVSVFCCINIVRVLKLHPMTEFSFSHVPTLLGYLVASIYFTNLLVSRVKHQLPCNLSLKFWYFLVVFNKMVITGYFHKDTIDWFHHIRLPAPEKNIVIEITFNFLFEVNQLGRWEATCSKCILPAFTSRNQTSEKIFLPCLCFES